MKKRKKKKSKKERALAEAIMDHDDFYIKLSGLESEMGALARELKTYLMQQARTQDIEVRVSIQSIGKTERRLNIAGNNCIVGIRAWLTDWLGKHKSTSAEIIELKRTSTKNTPSTSTSKVRFPKRLSNSDFRAEMFRSFK